MRAQRGALFASGVAVGLIVAGFVYQLFRMGRSDSPRPDEALPAAEAFSAEINHHHASMVDVAWSQAAKQDFDADLQALLKGQGHYSIDCRTSSCMVTLTWSDLDVANTSAELLGLARYRRNCAQRISSPVAVDAGFSSTLLFSCR